MPDPIQSVSTNSCEYPILDENTALPVASATNGPSAAPAASTSTSSSTTEPAVEQLVRQHPSSSSARHCTSEKAALLVATGALIRSVGAMVVTAPTALGEIPAITSFVASSIAVGVTAAQYLNCEDDAG